MFNLPTAGDVVSSSTEYATSLTTEFLPFLYVIVGITAAVVLIVFLQKLFRGGIRRVGGMNGKRRRR